ncbi:MAG: twin-arginine translocation signal domain-containing protein, partial [Rhodospirillales bacterium]|nr:twin-arginine translocation signal domain-containing protein [Rhodospirillales bacterium]
MFEHNRRDFIRVAGAAALAVPTLPGLLYSKSARAAIGDTLTIAYNVTLPAWDPTTGFAAVNPATMAIYKSVYDQYLDQSPDLTKIPGLMTEWGWNADRTKIHFT